MYDFFKKRKLYIKILKSFFKIKKDYIEKYNPFEENDMLFQDYLLYIYHNLKNEFFQNRTSNFAIVNAS